MYCYKDEISNFNYIEFKPLNSSSYFIAKEQLLRRKTERPVTCHWQTCSIYTVALH